MNNVWTAIAFRAPCAARPIPRKPLLQLFNGYTRRHASIRPSSNYARPGIANECSRKSAGYGTRIWSHEYTTSAVLLKSSSSTAKETKSKKKTTAAPSKTKSAARKPSSPGDPKSSPNDSKITPAPTVASHTEGSPAEEETLTWRDYDPIGGMPLPDGERSQVQINKIFGNEELEVDTGNYILSVMQWRRMSGALMDSGLDFPKDSGVTRDQALVALEHVRTLDPAFDEQAAGQTWVEEESIRLQEELQERAIKLRLYKSDEPEPEPETAEESDQGTEYGRDRSQDSALLRLRAENKARNEREEAERIAAQERAEVAALHKHRGPLQLSGGVQPPTDLQITETGGMSITRPQQNAWLQPVERKPWVKYYEERAQILKDNEIPQLGLLCRLGPSFLMLLAILGLGIFVSDNYTPAPKSARMFPDTPPALATLAGLTGVLTVFFIASRIPPLWRTYSKYFTVVPAYPYSPSILGSIFRHDTLSHFLTNVASLWLFGPLLYDDVGRGTFLSIFLFCGSFGAYSALAYNVLRQNWMTYMFGSSGAVLGVLAASCALRPNGTLTVWGQDVPIAAWVFLFLYGAAETVAVVRRMKTNIDHVGHLGGMVAGFASAMWVKHRSQQQQQRAKEEGNSVVAAS